VIRKALLAACALLLGAAAPEPQARFELGRRLFYDADLRAMAPWPAPPAMCSATPLPTACAPTPAWTIRRAVAMCRGWPMWRISARSPGPIRARPRWRRNCWCRCSARIRWKWAWLLAAAGRDRPPSGA
jgi:hypothetical protein